MSDDAPNDPNAHTQTAAPAPQPAGNGAPTITPEVQALIDAARAEAAKQANDSAWKAARLKYEKPANGGQQPQQQPPQPHSQPPSAPDAMAVVTRLRAFDRAAGRFDLSESARDVLEQDFNIANPSDPAAWVQQRAEAFGWKSRGVTSNPNPAPGSAPSAPPAASPSGPPPAMPPNGAAPARVVTEDTPFWTLSKDEQSALIKRMGPFEFKKLAFKQLAESGQRFSLRR